jgi:hypothetical protein
MIIKIIGVLLICAGIILGLYVGVWVCLVGGVVQVVNAAKANPTDVTNIALGVIRFFCASLCGGATFWLCALLGSIFIIAGDDRRSRY